MASVQDVGDIFDQCAIGGVSDAGHDWDAGGEHGADDPFVVEREVVARAATTSEDDDVDVDFVQQSCSARTMLSAAPAPCTCAGESTRSASG